jgi:hypothetical protein
MNRAAAKLLLLQARKLIDFVIERWDDAGGEDVRVDGVVDDDVLQREKLREQLRRRGVNL